MRGKGCCGPDGPCWPGITPAYAGKRRSVTWGTVDGRDHPRVCGEKMERFTGIDRPAGSPPRMRGKGSPSGSGGGRCGITPAYAGKSHAQYPAVFLCWDHPRVCGEKHVSMISSKSAQGSPPRMRGKGDTAQQCSKHFGITPAYAGKRDSLQNEIPYFWDHPRVCGEKRM